MAVVQKIYNFKGLSTRVSHLLRPDEYLTDCLNIYKSKKGSLLKRPGQVTVDDTEGGNGLVNYNSNEGLIGVGTNIADLSTGAWVTKTNSGQNTLDTTNQATFTEDNKRLFIANGVNELLKYDGLSWYRAGISNPSYQSIKSVTPDAVGANSVNYEFAIQWVSRDRHGNIVESQINKQPANASSLTYAIGDSTTSVTVVFAAPTKTYTSLSASDANKWEATDTYSLADWVVAPDNKVYAFRTAGPTVSATPPASDPTNWQLVVDNIQGFCSRSAKVNGAQTNVTTVTVDSGHDILVGDYIFVKPSATLLQDIYLAERNGFSIPEFEEWRQVTAVAATTITFSGSADTNFPDDYIISPNLLARVYAKTQAATDYGLFYEAGVNSFTALQSFVFSFSKTTTAIGDDTEPVQLRFTPPVGNYLGIHQSLLTISGISDELHTIYWSNTENLETFDITTNSIIVGDNNDGPVMGQISNNDVLIVFKLRAIYFVHGELGTGQIRVERVLTNNIGCVSAQSIKEINGVVYFLSATGVYRIRGGSLPEEVSFQINDLFAPNTLTGAVAIHDPILNHYRVCVANSVNRTFVYDYVNDEWYLWSNVDYTNGAAYFNNVLYFTLNDVPVTTRREQTTFSDAGSAIQGYGKSNWFHGGAPSDPKKVNNIKFFALEGAVYTLRVRSERDWTEGTYYTDINLSFTSTVRFLRDNYVSGHDRSFRLYFENNTLNEGFEVTGLEMEIELPYSNKLKR